MRAEWIIGALAVALAGCDVVFRLDRLSNDPVDAVLHDDAGLDAPPVEYCALGMHDEDRDGHADPCDVCPGIADDQEDGDRDGVGNACDPSEDVAHEIALFLAFSHDPYGWNLLGNWSNDGESMVYASSEQVTGKMVYKGTMPEPPFVLEYHYTLDSIQDATGMLTVILDSNANGDGLTCGHRRSVPPHEDVVRVTYGPELSDEGLISQPVVPGDYRVTATYDRHGNLSCALAADDAPITGAKQLDFANEATPPAGTLGFRAMLFGVHLHYVAIYKER